MGKGEQHRMAPWARRQVIPWLLVELIGCILLFLLLSTVFFDKAWETGFIMDYIPTHEKRAAFGMLHCIVDCTRLLCSVIESDVT